MSNASTTAAEDQNVKNGELFRYITFYLNKEIIGVSLNAVKEVLEVKEISILPRTPDFVRGVINLRGQIVPVIDLKLKFGMGETEFTVDSCIIIVEVVIDDEPLLVGALADSVRDVVELFEADIDSAPAMGSSMDSKFIVGMSRHNDEFFTMLNIDVLFSKDELMFDLEAEPISSALL